METLACTDCFFERKLIASQGMFGAYQGKPGHIRLTTHGKDNNHHLCLIRDSSSLSSWVLVNGDEFISDRPPTGIAALQLFTLEWPGHTSTLERAALVPGTWYLMHD